MLTSRRRPLPGTGEDGFSVLELIIVSLVMTIVMSIAGTSLYSMSQGANRGDTLVQEEQMGTLAISNIAKDVRSAHTLSSSVSGSPTSTELVLLVNVPGATANGSTYCQTSSANPDYTPVPYQLVEWLYQSSTSTLTRTLLNCGASGNPSLGTTWSLGPKAASGRQLSVTNGSSSKAVFQYYNEYGTNISSALPGAIASCTTRVGLDLLVSSNTKGAATVEEKQNAALTDQLNILSQPGNGQC